ncbi:TPA: hypothetical protein ACX87D_001614 [Legionella pneumophila]
MTELTEPPDQYLGNSVIVHIIGPLTNVHQTKIPLAAFDLQTL